MSMALLKLLKQTHSILLIFRVSFKTIKLLKMLCQVLETQGVEFLRDPQRLKSDLVQGRLLDVPVAKLCRGPMLAGIGPERSTVRLWECYCLPRNT